ncbi:hypothetical protein HLH32_03725 [Gluconacetobacter liquefaciens]|uniref:Uncharacterized protein n=1 Tax=Gluconacetobacter liquefaciens TaxID=89584 RepID=A0A7W4P969_GLULI|nr:hypothetical protein [Gluconacetobacter liquefaciens]MBB2185503.1 hypothetical protein [Gluconacetobacter liquefaciens]
MSELLAYGIASITAKGFAYENWSFAVTAPTALELYRRFVAIIDRAWTEKNIYAVPEAAAKAGMEGKEKPRGMSQSWDYSYRDPNGFELLVHARWWDQSQAFSIRPDMHVMTAELKGETRLMYHEQRYEE